MKNMGVKKHFLLAICFIVSFFSLCPNKANAVFGVADQAFVTVTTDVSPSGISNWYNTIATHLKDYVLDGLAAAIAKQILHQITVSVINWINNGFHGSPAFITNPGEFFADVADQVTGDMISKTGVLSQLCSPFNVDVRLGVSLGEDEYWNSRYTCTLSTVIDNAKNSSVNGYSIKGFVDGDFSQGGWPAFIAMTTEPQNNPHGAYLQAQSEIMAGVGRQNSVISMDLQMGSGFMSFDSCDDVSAPPDLTDSQKGTLNKTGSQTVVTGKDRFGNDSSIQKKVGKGGAVSYQSCQTQTPGSAVSSKLFANINSPELELAVADSINSIISAGINQLAATIISKGLHALSSGGSGSRGGSYTDEAIQDILNESKTTINTLQVDGQNTVAFATQGLEKDISNYSSSIDLVVFGKGFASSTVTCFQDKLTTPKTPLTTAETTYGNNMIADIKAWANRHIYPSLDYLSGKKMDASDRLKELQDATSGDIDLNGGTDVRGLGKAYDDAIKAAVNASDNTGSTNDLNDSKTLAQQAKDIMAPYQAACTYFPETLTTVTPTP